MLWESGALSASPHPPQTTLFSFEDTVRRTPKAPGNQGRDQHFVCHCGEGTSPSLLPLGPKGHCSELPTLSNAQLKCHLVQNISSAKFPTATHLLALEGQLRPWVQLLARPQAPHPAVCHCFHSFRICILHPLGTSPKYTADA